MQKKVIDSFIVLNDKGLHTRPCTELVKCAAEFDAQVTLSYNNYAVNAKSILGLLMLAAGKGAEVKVEAEGEEAEQVVEALLRLAKNRFNMKY